MPRKHPRLKARTAFGLASGEVLRSPVPFEMLTNDTHGFHLPVLDGHGRARMTVIPMAAVMFVRKLD